MGDKTGIAWTDATWNPVTGCSKVSQGCKHCYAERVFPRAYHGQTVRTLQVEEVSNGIIGREGTRPRRFTDVRCHPERLDQPLRWRRPRRVFVNSMSDLFHPDVPDEFIAQVFAVMAASQQHTFQVLTKRPERMRDLMWGTRVSTTAHDLIADDPLLAGGSREWPLPNVWLGVSVEDQATADERIPVLLDTPAAVRFVSAEPLLGPVDLFPVCAYNAPGDGELVWKGPDWVIVGGESGPKARPFDLAWARDIVAQCREAEVPVFVKQLGANPITCFRQPHWSAANTYSDDTHHAVSLRHRAGAVMAEWPADLQIQEWPA